MIRIIAIITILVMACSIMFFAVALLSSNHVKCPKCGKDMDYIGNDATFDRRFKGLPEQMQHHFYKCPECGTTKVI